MPCCLLRGAPMVAEGEIYFVCVQWHVSIIRFFHSLLLIIPLPPLGSPPTSPLAVMLRVIQLTVIVLTLAIFITMSVSCPSGLCLSASLPLVTSQARLESDVLEPQPGVTAGFAVCSRLLVVRTGILRSLLTSLNRFRLSVMAPLIRQSVSESAYWFSFILGSPASAGYQSDSARVRRP